MLPLMDMVFLLLVLFIFMLIRMRPDFGISVILPKIGVSAEERPKVKKKQVTISVTADNMVYVNKDLTDMASLSPTIRRNVAPDEEVEIILKGDKVADYGIIMEVFHELRSAGISNVLFDVERREQTTESFETRKRGRFEQKKTK